MDDSPGRLNIIPDHFQVSTSGEDTPQTITSSTQQPKIDNSSRYLFFPWRKGNGGESDPRALYRFCFSFWFRIGQVAISGLGENYEVLYSCWICLACEGCHGAIAPMVRKRFVRLPFKTCLWVILKLWCLTRKLYFALQVELESLRSELACVEEREAHLKAQ